MWKFSLLLLCFVASIFKRNIVGGISSPDSDASNSHQRQELGYQNLLLNNTSLDDGSTQDSYLHNLDKSRKAVYQNLLSNNTSSLLDSHIHTPSQNQQANYENLISNNTSTTGGFFPDSGPHTHNKILAYPESKHLNRPSIMCKTFRETIYHVFIWNKSFFQL